MARAFDADTDALHDIVTDHYTMPSGGLTLGIWRKVTAGTIDRNMLELNKWGVGTGALIGGMDYGAGDTRTQGLLGFTTQNEVVVSNYGTLTADSVWRLWVITFDGTTANTWHIYMGTVTEPMREVTSGEHNPGSGTRHTGAMRLILGNTWSVNSAIRGEIAEAFALPDQWNLLDCERFRLGDWDPVLSESGTPIFFYPLDGSNLNDETSANVLSDTGTSVVADPRTGGSGVGPDMVLLALLNDSAGVGGHYGTGSFTTDSFTPLATTDSLLVAIVAYETWATGTAPDITISDSGSHVWTQEIISLGLTGGGRWGQSVAIFTAPNTSSASITVTVNDNPDTDMATWKVQVVEVVGLGVTPTPGQTKALTAAEIASPRTLTFDATPAATSITLGAFAEDEDSSTAGISGNRIEVFESDVTPVLNLQRNSAASETSFTWTYDGSSHTVGAAIEITEAGGDPAAVYVPLRSGVASVYDRGRRIVR